jgi:hypothetical protein
MSDTELAELLEEVKLVTMQAAALSGQTELLLRRTLKFVQSGMHDVGGVHVHTVKAAGIEELLRTVFGSLHAQ